MHAHIDIIYDKVGNIAAIGGVWEVSDEFDREEEFKLFLAEWEPRQPKGKRGKLCKKTLDKQYKAWQKWLSAKYTKIKYNAK